LVSHSIQEVPLEEYFTFQRVTLGNGNVVFMSRFNESFRCDVCSRKTKKLKDSKDAHADYCPQSKCFKGLVENLGKRVRAKGYSSLDDYIAEKYSGSFPRVVVPYKLASAGRRGRQETPTPTDPDDSSYVGVEEEDKKLPAKITKKHSERKEKNVPEKKKNKQNESNKLPVASAAATAAAAAAALLEAEEDMDSTANHQYDTDDGLGSYEGIVVPESPVRSEKASSSQKKKKNIVGVARAGGVGGKDSSSSSSERPSSPGVTADDDWVPKGRAGARIGRTEGPDLRPVTKPPERISGIHYPPPVLRLPKNAPGEKEKEEMKNIPEPSPKKRGRPSRKSTISTEVVINRRTKKSKSPPEKEKRSTMSRSPSNSRSKKNITLFPGNRQVILWNKILEFPGFAKELNDIFFHLRQFLFKFVNIVGAPARLTWMQDIKNDDDIFPLRVFFLLFCSPKVLDTTLVDTVIPLVNEPRFCFDFF